MTQVTAGRSSSTEVKTAPERSARPLIRLFGPLSIEDGERTLGPADLGGARPKQVLEILLAARGHRVPTDRLAELLWGEQRPQNVAGSLQTFVSNLRRHLATDVERGRELVVTEPEAYRFATDLVALDLDCFDRLLERSAREPTHRARAALEHALDLVRGEVLEDEPYATWALDLRGSYQGRVLGARLDAADAALAELDFAAALAHAEQAAALDQFSERSHRAQMLALHALDRMHEALARYRQYRQRLDDELGLEPSAETRALEAAVIRQEDVRALLPRPIRSEHGNADGQTLRLIGRRAELDTLEAAIRRGLAEGMTLIQVEGETGLGKTRLLDELHLQLGGVRVGRAKCSLLERHLGYVPLATALREALADVELDASRLPPLRQILPELELGTPRSDAEEIEVLEALVALVAEHGPIVLLLDDLHCADPRTLAALGYLRRRGTALSGAIVTTTRPTAALPGAPYRLSADLRVRLEPLSPAELAPLGIPDLHASTGGEPRLVAEALTNGHAASPSATLNEALVAQCRAEGDWAFRVLVAASVLEQPFDAAPLAELLDVDEAELVEGLERLCERRILRVDGFRFRFRYDLVRQALLESISPARQRLLQQRLDRPATAVSETG
ncbi:MAG TPA: BTAD domain-containing putative transcriptional regulator [Gaiellaceae bacterium]|nr:BTAD domain-containing putative transcriptional regulator [Gaiellaceae bacterium]